MVQPDVLDFAFDQHEQGTKAGDIIFALCIDVGIDRLSVMVMVRWRVICSTREDRRLLLVSCQPGPSTIRGASSGDSSFSPS
jgi:hypothetical protein